MDEISGNTTLGGKTMAAATDGRRYLEPNEARAAAIAGGCEIWSPRWQRGAFDAIPAFVERALST